MLLLTVRHLEMMELGHPVEARVSRGRLWYRRGRPRDVGSVEVYVLVKPVEVRAYRRLRMWAVRHPEMMD